MSYLISIKTAFLIFPLIALLFTIPFILHQYHKYGSINKLRCLIIYSFILYMITIYFLVILPLPHIADVTYKSGMIRLLPFSFIFDIIKESNIVYSDIGTFINILKTNAFYTTLLNIFMTVPFGMYLRYYFKCSFKKTCYLSFLLSLFFELTQLSGLYFIYPYQYRVFDVDDLIMNTLGGIIGFYIVSLFNKILPSRDEIDRKSLEEGKKVTGLRRFTVYCLDFIIFNFILIFIRNIYLKLIIFIIYYAIIPEITNGLTIAGKFLNVRFCTNKFKTIKYLSRFIIIYYYYFKMPFYLIILETTIFEVLNILTYIKSLIYFTTLIFILIFYIVNIIQVLKNKSKFYDSLFSITYKSTIKEQI